MYESVRPLFSLSRQSPPSRRRSVSIFGHACLVCLLLGVVIPFSGSDSLSANAAETSPTAADTSPKAAGADQPSADSGRRYVLKGKTAVTDFRLNDLAVYRSAKAAFDKKNYAGAERLFKQAVTQLGDGYEKHRAECLYFRAKCLEMTHRADEAITLYKQSAQLFDQHDPQSPLRGSATAQVFELSGGKQWVQVSVDRHITLTAGVTKSDTNRHLLRVDEKAIPKIVYKCFAEMTCLETAEIGSNITNAEGRWHPLLVHENPAAFTSGASSAINVKLNGLFYSIDLPIFGGGLRRILLATDGEKICAMDVDSYESWLLHIKREKNGNLKSYHWSKLTHVKDGVEPATASSGTQDWISKPVENSSRNRRASETSSRSRRATDTNWGSSWGRETWGRQYGGRGGRDRGKAARARGTDTRGTGADYDSAGSARMGSPDSAGSARVSSPDGGNTRSFMDSGQSQRHFGRDRRARGDSGF